MPADYRAVPFKEAITFFRQKINLPTRAWTDLWAGMHARAFVIAGATQQDLLTDFRTAIDKAIADGTTLTEFRKDFDGIVKRHGWTYNGGRGWRSKVIYDTNIRQAYNAGREAQFRDPAFRKQMPYLLYRHGDTINPRPLHLAWDGLVLSQDDPWWDTHTPMNGWGCKCKKFALSETALKAQGKTGPDAAPDNGSYEWRSADGTRSATVPNGIDPGFDYHVGDAAWGKPLSQAVMAAWDAQKGKAWVSLTPGGIAEFDRPDHIPLVPSHVKLGKRLTNESEVKASLQAILGGEEKTYLVGGLPVLVNADSLAKHIPLDRSEFIPLLAATLTDPYEVWQTFERHKGTGRVVLRRRMIKGFDIGKGKAMVVVTNAVRGMMEAWTFIPTTKVREIRKRRRGKLIQGK